MPLPKMYRFNDLKASELVKSRPQLKHLIEEQGFPEGRLLSPNVRAWTEQEILDWLDSRPRDHADPERYRVLGRASTAKREGKSPKAAKATTTPASPTEAA